MHGHGTFSVLGVKEKSTTATDFHLTETGPCLGGHTVRFSDITPAYSAREVTHPHNSVFYPHAYHSHSTDLSRSINPRYMVYFSEGVNPLISTHPSFSREKPSVTIPQSESPPKSIRLEAYTS